MEGYAVARIRASGDTDSAFKPGAPMRNVEIAWENWMDGTSGRGAIQDAGLFELGDVKPRAAAARQSSANGAGTTSLPPEDLFDPDLLSVSLGGIFVRPHSASASSAHTFFYEPGGKLSRFEFPAWPTSGSGRRLDVRADAVVADGQPLAVGMIEQGGGGHVSALLLAHRGSAASAPSGPAGGPWEIEAVTVAPPDAPDRIEHADWTYAGLSIGVTTLVADARRSVAWAMFQPFQANGTLGTAQPLPTPFDLGDAPRPCSAAERATTARLEAPLFLRGDAVFPGTRHPVLITDAPGPGSIAGELLLLTSSVVLHGTPASPCVAAWEASAIDRTPHAAIVPGDLGQGWLFRGVTSPPLSTGVSIEVRPMTCRFDPAAKVPDAVWREPGTTRGER